MISSHAYASRALELNAKQDLAKLFSGKELAVPRKCGLAIRVNPVKVVLLLANLQNGGHISARIDIIAYHSSGFKYSATSLLNEL